MSLTHYLLNDYSTPFDRFFDDVLTPRTYRHVQPSDVFRPSRCSPTLPRMDIHHDDKSNTVCATFELPGLQKEDVSIDVNNNILTVSGETKESTERNEEGYTLRERRYGKFSRSLSLPQGLKVSRNLTTDPCDGINVSTERGHKGNHEQWLPECRFP
ncbi:HSP20-like chaperone [Lactarius vividus]|nr:HSP20-like chaperone [Lactarius vividus]